MFNWLGEDILPHSSNLMLLLAMITADLATYLTRILPYIFLKKHTKNKILIFLQHNMGLFIMVVLIFYSLGVMEKKSLFSWVAIFLALISAFFFELKFKNPLVSIAASTAIYMLAIRIFDGF